MVGWEMALFKIQVNLSSFSLLNSYVGHSGTSMYIYMNQIPRLRSCGFGCFWFWKSWRIRQEILGYHLYKLETIQCLFGNGWEIVRHEVIGLCQDMSSIVKHCKTFKEVGLGNISAKNSEECSIPHSRTGGDQETFHEIWIYPKQQRKQNKSPWHDDMGIRKPPTKCVYMYT